MVASVAVEGAHDLGQLIEQHVAEGDAVVAHDVREPVDLDDDKLPRVRVRVRVRARRGDGVHARLETICRRRGVERLLARGFDFATLSVVDVVDDAYHAVLLVIGVLNTRRAHLEPTSLRRALGHGLHLDGRLLHLAYSLLDGVYRLGMRAIATEQVPEALRLVHAVVEGVHDLDGALVGAVGEERVVRALDGKAVTLFLLVEHVLLLQAVLGEVDDDAMELVDLGDGGAERAQLLNASLHAFDQTPERSVDGTRDQRHQHQASEGGKADGHAQAVVQRVACGEDGILGEQPDDRPARVVIRHDA